jgi:hypothetical protein
MEDELNEENPYVEKSIEKQVKSDVSQASPPKQAKFDIIPYVIYKAIDHPYPPPQPPRMGKTVTLKPKAKGFFI